MIEEIKAYFEQAPEPQRSLLVKLRGIILEAVPDAVEQFKWSRPVYGSPKDLAYLTYTKKHATLGFSNAAKIVDSTGKLEGTGKDLRHVKIKSEADIDAVLFRNWLITSSQ